MTDPLALIRELQGMVRGARIRPAVLTWPGATAFSDTLLVPHGYSFVPKGALATAELAPGAFAVEVFVTSIDGTNVGLRARASDGAVPAAGVTRRVFWSAT